MLQSAMDTKQHFVFKWCSKTLQWQGERTYHAQRPCEACACRDVLPARQQGITIVIPYFSLVYKTEPPERELTGKTIAVDMGEIHPIVSHDGENTIIYNGRFLRSLRRYREKIKAYFQAKIDISKRWSNRCHNLRRAKNKVLAKLDAQITDAEHKITSRFVSDCKKAKADTIVIGDLKGIRTKIKYGKKTNQKLHQWLFHRIASLIEYKAALNGIKVEFVSEAYTSQTCPCCGNRHKPSNRNYKCKKMQI